MGFYECVHDCGDNNYCVSVGSSLDNFESTSWIYCPKHKSRKNRNLRYNLCNFIRRHAKTIGKCIYSKIKILQIKTNDKGVRLMKAELLDFDISTLGLIDSEKIYFSEFNGESSWEIIDGKVYIITIYENINDNVNSPMCSDRNITFDWGTNQVINIKNHSELSNRITTTYLEFIEQNNLNSNIFIKDMKCTKAMYRNGHANECVCVSFEHNNSHKVEFYVRKKNSDNSVCKSISVNYKEIYFNNGSEREYDENNINKLNDENEFISLIEVFYKIVKGEYTTKRMPNSDPDNKYVDDDDNSDDYDNKIQHDNKLDNDIKLICWM